MIDAYTQGKDLYAVIGTKVYNNDYWDNMEKHEDGSPNPDGKRRRSICKKILLGIMYGEGSDHIAEELNIGKDEAQNIIDNFFKEFPAVRRWMDETDAFAKKHGYVEDAWGRRRQLRDILLPAYTVQEYNKKTNESSHINPIPFTKNVYVVQTINPLVEQYKNQLANARGYKDVNSIIKKAKSDGIDIVSNTGLIARATRQCVNSRIQGGAATMSKKAMILIYNDEEMRKLGFRLLIMVHDELIGECPTENVEKAKERLAYLMEIAGKPVCDIPMKCDAVEFGSWYLDEYHNAIRDEYKKFAKTMGEYEAVNELSKEYTELTLQEIKDIISVDND